MSQILTQEEINALLSGLADNDHGLLESEEKNQNAVIRKYDLTSQERIIRGRMPTMELIHDRFARNFRNSLANFLGRTCYASLGDIEIVKFGQFIKKLPLPSSLHIYSMPPLSGQAILVVSTPLVFGIVDSLFGGTGSCDIKIEGREYTPIESRLISKLVGISLENLRDAWAPVHQLDFTYLRSEFNPLAVSIVGPNDVVIVVTIAVELEHENTTLTLCIPYSTIEPIRHKLSADYKKTRSLEDSRAIRKLETHLKNTEVELRVQLAKGNISAKNMINLKVGDVIPLETGATEEATVIVEQVAKFKAAVGVSHGNRAIRISGSMKNTERNCN